MLRAGCDMRAMTDHQIFVGAFFAVIFSSHLSRLTGAWFEGMSGSAIVQLFSSARISPQDLGYLNRDVSEVYNKMVREGPIVKSVGSAFAKWISNPTEEGLLVLTTAFSAMSSEDSGRLS